MPLIPAPNHSSCFCEGIGACHFAEGRLEEAIVHFAAVAEIDPSEASLFNLANAQGKAEHSVAAAATYTPPTPNISTLFLYFFHVVNRYRRVLSINPHRHDAAAKLVHFTHYVCDWSRRKADVSRPMDLQPHFR